MIVRNYMSRNLATIDARATVSQALKVMRRKNIRHLPVLEGEKLLGMITDKDINASAGQALFAQLTMRELMHQPVAISADTAVSQAAYLLFTRKITGLLVMEDGNLAGIITLADMLKVLVVILDVLDHGIRLHLEINHKDSLENVYNVIYDQGAAIISVAILGGAGNIYSFRLKESSPGQGDAIVGILRSMGYTVERD
jgi:acetoin utilization protein AcuB